MQSTSNESFLRRNRPGTKIENLYNWKNQTFHEIDTTFASQEYISQFIRNDPSNLKDMLKLPENHDEDVWIYEHMRLFLLELNHFILHHAKVCTSTTDPEMKILYDGEELLFLCSAFKPPLSVPAIDYMVNTVACSCKILHDPKLFPNRYNFCCRERLIGKNRNTMTKKGMKEIKTMARRLYRIFAFSFYVHRQEFDEFEKKTHLCERFTKFVTKYNLMSEKLLLIPNSYWKKKNI